ncbi:flagellar hook-associated protein FlgK [Stutzerimonas stutzeri]|uniref:flagellar hook-associated protein FlgK n=1 Tax=Stutzerimonas stutzeri TaxID=316 RepID=UPI0015E47FB2|nr:flagellar hook-associated protein FlgK [Stutzerimonas stutzeri]MBA1278511.1 flagellar hook-associated protein FlgK [Stutzerimonas stutzeri]
MADLLNIGLSGLSASKSQLSITGHNISNVNTPGYSRQDASQATRTPQFSGAGYVGSGTTLVEIRRTYSEFLTSQLRSSTSLSSDVEAYKSQIDQLDSLLAGSTTGITPSLQKFFSALQTAAEDPANIPARQLVLAEAEGLARRFNTVSDRLTEQNNFTNKQMAAVTDQINRLAGSIGSLNQAIATASANGKQPNDLLDARDEAVRQLSTYIGVTVTPQDDNSFNISVGTGQPLVVGSAVSRLEIVPGQGDPNRHEIQFVSGGSRQGITSQITGGELGGLIRYRQEVLDPTLNSLGQLALAVSDQVNTQLGQGLDLKGNVGVGLFKDINAADLVDKRSYPTGINVEITNTSSLAASDYEIEIGAGDSYRIRPVGGRWIEGQTFGTEVPGLGFNLHRIDSSLGEGDKVLIMPTRRGASEIGAVLDQADQLAFAAAVRAESSLQNGGTGAIGQPDMVSAPSPIDPAELKTAFGSGLNLAATVNADGTFTLSAATGNWSYVDENGNSLVDGSGNPATPTLQSGNSNTVRLAYTAASGEVYQFDFTINGRPQTNDSFSLNFNQSGVSDNRNALKLVDLQTKQTIGVDGAVVGSGSSFTDGYGELVERVGTLTAQARMDSEATGAILKQATDNRDSLSAVNLDEEAANLIKFEQYYNASAQIIQVARTMFDTLISTFR